MVLLTNHVSNHLFCITNLSVAFTGQVGCIGVDIIGDVIVKNSTFDKECKYTKAYICESTPGYLWISFQHILVNEVIL